MIVEARIRHTGAITAKCLFSIITQLNILPQAQKTAAHKLLLYGGYLLIHQANHYATGTG